MELNLFRPMPKRSTKWIDGLRPEMRVSQAARRTLRRRLDAVWQWLRKAARRASESTEHVHQLRVATRRAMAALEGYNELLPPKKAATVTKRLKQIRRRAGPARDADVLIGRLKSLPDAARLKPLIEKVEQFRGDVQEPIAAIYRKLRRRKFPRDVEKLIDGIHTPRHSQETTFLQWARVGMSRTAESFFAAGGKDLGDLDLLHQFRIEGKHLRYAVEYFACAFGPELRNDIYPQIEKLQSVLGLVNDHHSALERLAAWRADWDDKTVRGLIDELMEQERRSLTEARQEFARWWTTDRSADLQRRLVALLRRPDEDAA